jgi:hypothetical protein
MRPIERLIVTAFFAGVVVLIVWCTYYLMSTSLTPEQMSEIENKAIAKAKHCYQIDYQSDKCQAGY